MTLPPFGSVHRCPKCGEQYGSKHYSQEPGREYRPAHYPLGHVVDMRKSIDERLEEMVPETIIRNCLQCNYTWPEACWVDPQPGLPE